MGEVEVEWRLEREMKKFSKSRLTIFGSVIESTESFDNAEPSDQRCETGRKSELIFDN